MIVNVNKFLFRETGEMAGERYKITEKAQVDSRRHKRNL